MADISVYLFDAVDQLDASFVANQIPRLPAFRRNQCRRFHHQADQATCLIAYLLLAEGLSDRNGMPRPEVFTYDETGKPSIETGGVFFSLSHCRRGVVCALSACEVGVDIQDIRPFDSAVARRVCTNAELMCLARSNEPADLFCQMWTAKESYGKALGVGVVGVLRQDLPTTGFRHWRGPDYWLTTYCDDPDARTVIHTVAGFDTWDIGGDIDELTDLT